MILLLIIFHHPYGSLMMKTLLSISVLLLSFVLQSCQSAEEFPKEEKLISLPKPNRRGDKSLEETIASRRSVRSFSDRTVGIEEIGQLLWAAQGITDKNRGFRAAPSAGALYPLEVYAVTREGVYRYLPKEHSLKPVRKGDFRGSLCEAALNQPSVKNAPLVIVIAADYSRTTRKYKSHGTRYVHMEVGHCGQNIHLQAVALGLNSVSVGAFSEEGVRKVLLLPEKLTPLYLIPVGYRK